LHTVRFGPPIKRQSLRLASHLSHRPFPHFEAAPGRRGLMVRIDPDGTRTVGRFVNREFRPSK
jgi:hypothetical protein